MAAAPTRRSLLPLLLVALAACLGAASGAASYDGQRLKVPVHHGGAPVATDRRGQRGKQRVAQQQMYGGYDEYESSDGFLPYVLPALAITGLSLLFPNIVTVNTGRRRRDAGEVTTPTEELTEHMMNVYFAAMESDECLQRVVCELGASAKSLKPHNQNIIVSMLGSVSSKKYASLFEKFKSGMNSERCQKIGCGFLDN